MALAEARHHTAPRGQRPARARREEESEMHHARGQTTPPPKAAAAEFFPLTPEAEVGGELTVGWRTTPLVEVRPQERIQQHTVEHIVDLSHFVQILDVHVLQVADQVMAFLEYFGTLVPDAEQVIEVPKIACSSGWELAARLAPCAATGGTVGGSANSCLPRADQTGRVEWPQTDHGDLHRDTRYLLLGKDGTVSKKLCLSQGVHQGSVEGPVVFLALHSAIMDKVKDTRGSVGMQGVWACDNNNEEQEEGWQDVSEVAFVDDMLSLLVYDTEDEVEVWATRVIMYFETFEMTANVSKLEIMVVAWGKGSKPITRQAARGRLKFRVRGITIKATTSAKCLGTRIDVGAARRRKRTRECRRHHMRSPD